MAEVIKVNDDIEAYLAKPEDGSEVKGAVLVIHEIWGLRDHTKSIADRLAKEGYIALAPELLSELEIDDVKAQNMQEALFNPETRHAIQPELRQLTAPIHSPEFATKTIERTKQCFDYLFNIAEANQKVAVMGYCFGGTYSFNLAIQEPRLKIAIPYYGHCDEDVDSLKKINCPIVAFYGAEDERLVSGLDDLKARMEQASVDFEAKVYPNCGHAFFNDTNPYAYNKEAAEDSWSIVLEKLTLATA